MYVYVYNINFTDMNYNIQNMDYGWKEGGGRERMKLINIYFKFAKFEIK